MATAPLNGDSQRIQTFAPEAKRVMSSFDLLQIIRELKLVLLGSRVENLYNPGSTTILVALHPSREVVLEAGRRVHLTRYVLERPKAPSLFCSILRRDLRNGRLEEVDIEGFERIIYLAIGSMDKQYRLVVETFGSGNILLLDNEGKIVQALTYRRMRDRNILRGEAYKLPPLRGKAPFDVTYDDVAKMSLQKGDAAQALSRVLGLGSPYVDEILLRAGVEKSMPAATLEKGQTEAILNAVRGLVAELDHPEPQIIANSAGAWLDVVPFGLRLYEAFCHVSFPSFNEAADAYFTQLSAQLESIDGGKEVDEKVEEQRRIVEQQTKRLEELKSEDAEYQKTADMLYAHLTEVQGLLDNVNKTGWKQIATSLQKEAINSPGSSGVIHSLDTTSGHASVEFEGLKMELDLRKSVYENAKAYYEKAKEARLKAKGTAQAIGNAEAKLKAAEKAQSSEEKEMAPVLVRERAWYEKFHWARTKQGFLVVGGRDAVTNEILVKKQMQPADLVLHADIPGAPFTIVKTEGKTVSEEDILEAAQVAASYSSAWKAKSASSDVYWVTPEQVSKEAPSGEYLSRGAFMVRGKKNYVRNVPVRLAIGIAYQTGELKLVAGSPSTVKETTDLYVQLVPGRMPSAALAKAILGRLGFKNAKLRPNILKIPLEEVQSLIPAGGGEIAADSKR